jgi:hypothetical protein
MSKTIDYASGATASRGSSLVRIGGALGIASNIIGLGIFLTACAGFEAGLSLSLIPLILAGPGFILTIIGGVFQRDPNVEDTHVLAAIFINVAGIAGAMLEIAAWRHWAVFAGGAPS